MKTKWTDKDLMREFRRINKKHFGGKLEVLYVRFEKLHQNAIGRTVAYRTMFERAGHEYGVSINVEIQHMRAVWITTLIHEMVHVEQRNRYHCGPGRGFFNKRMRELAAAGAFDGMW